MKGSRPEEEAEEKEEEEDSLGTGTKIGGQWDVGEGEVVKIAEIPVPDRRNPRERTPSRARRSRYGT